MLREHDLILVMRKQLKNVRHVLFKNWWKNYRTISVWKTAKTQLDTMNVPGQDLRPERQNFIGTIAQI